MKIVDLFYRVVKNFRFLPKKTFLKVRYRYYNGKKLNLDNPVDFNEKIQWLKYYYHVPLQTQLADKYSVRDYVAKMIGEQYLNTLYGVYKNPDEINFDQLPNQFVLKANHASSTNMIVKDKSKLDIQKAKKIMAKWLRHNQYKNVGYEWAYKNIEPLLICEAYLEDKKMGSLTDYKFYCFNGKPRYITAQSDVLGKHFYDLDWKILPFSWINDYEGSIPKPETFEEMKKLAEKLADRLPFVRVDFYLIDGKTIFGEMTFYPTDGKDPYYPREYNKIVGDYMKLPEIPEGEKEITHY